MRENHSALFADLSELDGPGFRAAGLRPEVRDFYERTSRWHLEARTRWTPAFRPAGGLVRLAFGRRVQQLALPPGSPAAQGIDSRVGTFVDPAGTQVAAAWLRTLRPTGEYVASGAGVTTPPAYRSTRRSTSTSATTASGGPTTCCACGPPPSSA